MEMTNRGVSPFDRRIFLKGAGGTVLYALLGACGAGGAGGTAAMAPAQSVTAVEPPLLSPQLQFANALLTLEYVGAQFHTIAAGTVSLPEAMLAGLGARGQVIGGHPVPFRSALVAEHAFELAAEKQAKIDTFRRVLGANAGAQPQIDLSTTPTSAFSQAAQAAGMVPPGTVFDPFASDRNYLLGALLTEDSLAAAYRGLGDFGGELQLADALSGNLADSIYHGGLVRSLLTQQTVQDEALVLDAARAAGLVSALDGSSVIAGSAMNLDAASANLVDAEGLVLPFRRGQDQLLDLLFLSSTAQSSGGFLPGGINGVGARA